MLIMIFKTKIKNFLIMFAVIVDMKLIKYNFIAFVPLFDLCDDGILSSIM